VLQCVAVSVSSKDASRRESLWRELLSCLMQCVAVVVQFVLQLWCSVLQCVAIVLQLCCSSVAVSSEDGSQRESLWRELLTYVMQLCCSCVAVVMQCVAVCCSCVAVVLQCVAGSSEDESR